MDLIKEVIKRLNKKRERDSPISIPDRPAEILLMKFEKFRKTSSSACLITKIKIDQRPKVVQKPRIFDLKADENPRYTGIAAIIKMANDGRESPKIIRLVSLMMQS